MSECKLNPVEYKVVILPDKVEEMAGEGLIAKPEMRVDQEQQGQVKGTIVAASEMAFSDWQGLKPSVGDRVYFGKFAGIYTDEKGPNGIQYRIIRDKDIAATLSE